MQFLKIFSVIPFGVRNFRTFTVPALVCWLKGLIKLKLDYVSQESEKNYCSKCTNSQHPGHHIVQNMKMYICNVILNYVLFLFALLFIA